MIDETKNIKSQDIDISATCVRVPVKSHFESVSLTLTKPTSGNISKRMRYIFNGLHILDDTLYNKFPEFNSINTDEVYVDLVRKYGDKTEQDMKNFYQKEDQLQKNSLICIEIYKIISK